jgi:uncharacterized membrane protein HdeD (DUF308 family)
MTTEVEPRPLVGALRSEIAVLRSNWGWFLALGVVLVVVGMLAVSMSFAAGLATVTVLAVIALLAAATEFASAVWSRRWQGVLVHLLIGALYAVFGFLILSKPGMALATLTLLVAAMFLIGGIFRVVVAVAMRFPNWGWEAAGGAVSVVLGMMIWQDWPESAVWAIGLLVGIDLIFTGLSWVVLALGLRRLPDASRAPAV